MCENDNESDPDERRGGQSSLTLMCHSNEDVDGLSANTTFHVLANRDRRIVLVALRDSPTGTMSVSALASVLDDHTGFTGSQEQAATRLHHTHLPKLSDVGLLDHNTRDGTVKYVGHPKVEAALDLVAEWGKDGLGELSHS